MASEINFEILENGDVKLTTGKIAGPEHLKAENVLRSIEESMGKKAVRARSKQGHVHHHEGQHEHA